MRWTRPDPYAQEERWRWRFALWPTRVADGSDWGLVVWLEWYGITKRDGRWITPAACVAAHESGRRYAIREAERVREENRMAWLGK